MLLHLLHPLALYFSGPRPAPARLVEETPDAAARIDPALRQRLLTGVSAMRLAGFEAPLFVMQDAATSGVSAATALFERADRRAIAFVQAAQSSALGPTLSVVMSTTFGDGRQLSTSNTRVVMRTPPQRSVDSLSIPSCDDPRSLWVAHDHRVREREARSRVVPTTRGADPIGFQFDEEVAVQAHWVKQGYFTRLPDGRLRFTVKGAALASWRGLYPWKQATERRHARNAAAVLRGAGLPS